MRLGAFENEHPYGLRGVVPELAESWAAASRHAAANTRSVVEVASVVVVPHATLQCAGAYTAIAGKT